MNRKIVTMFCDKFIPLIWLLILYQEG